MTRILLALLISLFVISNFGCAMKSRQDAPLNPSLQQKAATEQNKSLTGESDPFGTPTGKISEETITSSSTMPSAASAESANPVEKIASSLQVVPFDYNQHLLSDEARRIITANAAILKSIDTGKVHLAGHCDERGSDQFNIALGERRAETVRAYLVDLGLAESRIESVSYGEEQPVDPGHDENAWAKNRRVEFILLP